MLHVAEGAEGFSVFEIMNSRESVRVVMRAADCAGVIEGSNGS
jgi:hypothetical protein